MHRLVLLLILGVGIGLAVPSTGMASTAPIFAVGCPVSHRAADDPIVYPGQPGAAHSHEFSGNWTTDAHSTYESMRRAAQLNPGTTCNDASDTAAYWVPTLYDASNQSVGIESITAYFVPGKKDPRTVQAPPPDLKVIADMATSGAHGSGWHCGDATPASSGGTLNTKTIRNCAGLDDGPGGIFPDVTHLQAKIVFPDCWDGKNLDSPDHRSHMAYAGSGGVCPSSHPVPVPRLNMKVRYDSFGGEGFRLSSGAPATMHADFWNTWDQVELERRVQVCIRHVVDSSTRPCTEPGNPVTAANPNYPNPTPASAPEGTPEPEPDPGRRGAPGQETFPSKLEVLHARVDNGRLDILGDITRLADGDGVEVVFEARGERHRFDAKVEKGRLRFSERLPRNQRSAVRGIVTLRYAGNDRVRPGEVRLRADRNKARLRRGRLSIRDGVLRAEGTISRRARGVVRLRLTYPGPGGEVGSFTARARIRRGTWQVRNTLPQAARGGGYLVIQFTGYRGANMSGAQIARQVVAPSPK